MTTPTDTDTPPPPGIPCLMPARMDTAGHRLRGYITRISEGGAFISLDCHFVGTNDIVLFFRRPSDGRKIGIPGQVVEISPNGGLWKGRPSVRVRFSTAINLAPYARSWPAHEDPAARRRPALPEQSVPSHRQRGPSRVPETRVLSDVPVRFEIGDDTLEGQAGNFSKGGMYIACNHYPRVGSVVRVTFPVYTDGAPRDVAFNGVVRWFQQDRPELKLPTGFGIQIMSFYEEGDQVIYERFIERLLRSLSDSGDPEQG